MKFPASNEYLARLSSIGHAKELLTSEGYSVIPAERCGRLQASLIVPLEDFKDRAAAITEQIALKIARALLTERIISTHCEQQQDTSFKVRAELLIIRPE